MRTQKDVKRDIRKQEIQLQHNQSMVDRFARGSNLERIWLHRVDHTNSKIDELKKELVSVKEDQILQRKLKPLQIENTLPPKRKPAKIVKEVTMSIEEDSKLIAELFAMDLYKDNPFSSIKNTDFLEYTLNHMDYSKFTYKKINEVSKLLRKKIKALKYNSYLERGM